MEMIERVARAMAEASGVAWRTPHWDDMNNHWRHKARAAIEAMREPTVEMKFVGIQEEMYGIDATWKAMIDAALK